MTLKAVAGALGMSHGNLLHHFGSAAGLQTALMEVMVRDLQASLTATAERVRDGALPLSDLLDQVFDAFNAGGAGRLAAWMSLTGALGELDAVGEVVRQLTSALAARAGIDDNAGGPVASLVLLATLAAVGDALVGPRLEALLRQPPGAARETVTQAIAALLVPMAGASAKRP